jgi:hypothetical protein
MNKEAINAEVEKIRAILDEHPGGVPDEVARIQVRRHADAIIKSAEDQKQGYFTEKAQDIQMNIDRYYSARKHLQYRRDYTSGVDFLRGEIGSLLNRIESWHGWEDRNRPPSPLKIHAPGLAKHIPLASAPSGAAYL